MPGIIVFEEPTTALDVTTQIKVLAAEPDLIICDEITSALDHLVAEGIPFI